MDSPGAPALSSLVLEPGFSFQLHVMDSDSRSLVLGSSLAENTFQLHVMDSPIRWSYLGFHIPFQLHVMDSPANPLSWLKELCYQKKLELSTPCNGFLGELLGVGAPNPLSTPCNGFDEKFFKRIYVESPIDFQLHVMDSSSR